MRNYAVVLCGDIRRKRTISALREVVKKNDAVITFMEESDPGTLTVEIQTDRQLDIATMSKELNTLPGIWGAGICEGSINNARKGTTSTHKNVG